MKKRETFLNTILAASAVAGMTFTQSSLAWDNDLTIYAWGAGITGTATLNGRTAPSGPTEVDFDDILDKLEMAFMGHYEGMGDTWGFGASSDRPGYSSPHPGGAEEPSPRSSLAHPS